MTKSQTVLELWSRHHVGLDLEAGDPQASYRAERDSEGDSLTGASTLGGGGSAGGPASIAPQSTIELARPPRFRVEERIGQGGMGTVYRAEQENLGRVLALKTLSAMSQQQTRRFLAEARVTAFLDHPNIVPVHELGVTTGDQVFMAMKLVGGKEWKAVLEAERREETRGLEKELTTLLAVCNAVAFAHSKGIAHCDLKPENVMVGEFGEVQLMDWGLAVDIRDREARAAQEARAPFAEAVAAPCGTPCYMAPELAEGRGEDIGARTDVYLLGAILFELLEGRPPHRGRTLAAVLLAAAEGSAPKFTRESPKELRAIASRAMAGEVEERFASVKEFQAALEAYLAHRESTRISDEGGRILARCQAAMKGGGEAGRRDEVYADFAAAVASFEQAALLWEKNPAAVEGRRRARLDYARAALAFGDLGLAEAQIARLGDGSEPAELRAAVSEEKASRARARRQAKRLRWGLAGALTALVLGLVGGLAYYQRANAMIRREKERALARERISQDSLKLLVYRLQSFEDFAGPRLQALREELLNEAIDGFRRLRDTAAQEAPISQGTARAEVELGQILGARGKLPEALEAFVQAREVLEELRSRSPGDAELRRDLFVTWNSIGQTLSGLGEVDAGITAQKESLALAREAVAERPGSTEALALLTVALRQLGLQQAIARRREEALAAYQESVAVARRLEVLAPKNALWQVYLRRAEKGLADVMTLFDDHRGALEIYASCLERMRPLARSAPRNRAHQRDLCELLDHIAKSRASTGDTEGALAALEEAAGVARAIAAKDPEAVGVQHDLVRILLELGAMKRSLGANDEALKLQGEGLELARGLARENPSDLRARQSALYGAVQLGVSLRAAGDPEAAIEAYDEALALSERVLDSGLREANAELVRQARISRANALTDKGEFAAALSLFDEVLAAGDASADDHINRALVLFKLGRFKEAVPALTRAIALEGENPQAFYNRGFARYKLRKYGEALADLDRALELDPGYARAYAYRGAIERRGRKLEQAMPSQDKAIALDPSIAFAYYERGRILDGLRRLPEAIESYTRSLELKPNWQAYNNRGLDYIRLKKKKEALADWTRAIETAPDRAFFAYRNRGIFYKGEGELEKALRDFSAAIEVKGDYAEAYSSRGNVYYEQGELERARDDYKRFLDLAPRSRLAEAFRERLREIEERLAKEE